MKKQLSIILLFVFASWQIQAQVSTFDIYPGPQGSQPDDYTAYNGFTYFSANNPTYGRELWKTDGTAAGTTMVKDIYAGVLGSNPTNLFVANGILFFTANDGTHGNELWATNGTITKMVNDFNIGAASSNALVVAEFNNAPIVVTDSAGFLLYRTCPLGYELHWDPFLAKSFDNCIGVQSYQSYQLSLTFSFGGKLYYAGTGNGITDNELYSWDGTNAPVLVANINPTGNSNPGDFLLLNDTLYYSADDGVHGRELWATNINNSTTAMVADYNTGAGNGNPILKGIFNNKLVWFVEHDSMGNGNGATVHLGQYILPIANDQTSTFGVKKIPPKGAKSNFKPMTVFDNTYYIYFPATNPTTGTELYSWDGTNPPTLAIDYNTGTASSNPSNLFTYKDHLFFNATDANGNTNLVMYNGNTWGNVKDSASGSSLSMGNGGISISFTFFDLGNSNSGDSSNIRIGTVKDTNGNEEVGTFGCIELNYTQFVGDIRSVNHDVEFAKPVITQGSSDSLPIYTAWNFNNNNTFTAQLSDKDGKFNNPSSIGTFSSKKGGKMAVRYPSNIPQSENYRVRIVASSPADTSLPSNEKIALIPASFVNTCNTINPSIDSIYGDYAITYTYWQIDSLGLPIGSFAPVTVNDTLRFAPDTTNAEMMTIKSLNTTSGILNISQPKYNIDATALKVGKRVPVINNNATYAHIRTSPTTGLPYNPPYVVTPVIGNPFGFEFGSDGIPNLVAGPIIFPGRGHLILQPKPKKDVIAYAGNRYELQVRGGRGFYIKSCNCYR